MRIYVKRYQDNGEATLSRIFIEDEFECYGLEDEERKVKVAGETRVPEGIYPVKPRAEGTKHSKYLNKFGADFHKGMLCVTNAPDWKLENNGLTFQYVLIHIGNDDKNTEGCLLVGESVANENFISGSTSAYRKLYPKILNALSRGEEVFIEYSKEY